ncbi:MAG TPA: zinc ribbon domain-containing protein [Methanomassiliicoccales archaeon]|nr:zinc ribbon domain-containing protein [Methanomassiliicoccales archaeon]
MKRCVKCQAETDEGVQICHRCGSKQFYMEEETKVKCLQCGATNPRGSTDCYSCGGHL